MRRYHPSQYLITLVITAFIATSCGESKNPERDGMYTLPQLEEAIEERFAEYEWPPDFNLSSANIIENLTFPPDSYIEVPAEYQIIGGYHTCAWEITLLNSLRADDQALVDESMSQLVDVGRRHNPIENDDHANASRIEMYEKAVAGEPADLQRWVNNNCGQVRPFFNDALGLALGTHTIMGRITKG